VKEAAMTDVAQNSCAIIIAPKFTAAQVNEDCPLRLQQIGKEIAERLTKVDKQITLADNHAIAINKLIEEAKELCDASGFEVLQEQFFPDLGRTRIYELLAIATNKKSVEEIRASTRKRVAKSRANKAAASATVADKTEPQTKEASPEVEGGLITGPLAETTGSAKSRSGVNPRDFTEVNFTKYVMELDKITHKKRSDRFAKTAVPADILDRLGKYLTKLSELTRVGAAHPMWAISQPCSSGSPQRSAGDTDVKKGELETSGGATADTEVLSHV
jgi:hypothetical protein